MRATLHRALVLAAVAASVPSPARADPPHVVWIAGRPEGDVAGRARRWARRVARAFEADGARVSQEPDSWAFEPPGSSETRVQVLYSVGERIEHAREARAELHYHEAIRELLAAEQDVLGVLDVPGASTWYAEVEIALAITSTEIGHHSIAQAALARACSVDPARMLGGAEAPPDLVARAQSISRQIATGPRGRFDLESNVADSVVWLDGRRLGPLPTRIEASVGTHVVRVEAPGHRTWARALDVLEGSRPPVSVALAPEPAVEVAHTLRAATEDLAVDRIVESLARLESIGRGPRALWLVEASTGAIDRAIVVACRASGCSEPIRVDATRVESALPADPDSLGEPLELGALGEARAWLDEPIWIEPPVVPTPWWEEPWPWTIAGVVVLTGIGITIGVTWPQPTTETVHIVETGPEFEWRGPP